MRKVNKIMKITVAILLSLVLITSCVVSGLFAKYVTAESTRVTVGLKAFGITVTATPGAGLASAVGTSQVTAAENAVTYTFTGIKLKPGDDFSDAIRFTITGTAEVKVRVKIIQQVSLTAAHFAVPEGVGGLDADTYSFPMGFTFGAYYYNKTTEAYSNVIAPGFTHDPFGYSSADNQEKYFMEAVENKIDATHAEASDDYVYKDFNPTETIAFYADTDTSKSKPINTFDLGFKWPDTWPVGGTQAEIDKYDEISTYLGDNLSSNNRTFSVTYTVEIVQI